MATGVGRTCLIGPHVAFIGLDYEKSITLAPGLIMESTYGDRLHEPVPRMKTALRDVVVRTAARGEGPDPRVRARARLEHRPEVRIFGLDIAVEAEIVDVGAFSSHADQAGLLDFALACRPTLDRLFLVHGEEPQALALAQRLQEQGLDRVTVPHAGAFYDV